MTGLASTSALVVFGIAAVGVFGLLIGSFLNVVAYRVPAGRSIVFPPSACPNCGHEITAIDNIPVLSWLVLRGKCRNCTEPISARYPIVEALTGVFFAVVAWWFWAGPAASSVPIVARILELVAFLYLAAISVVLALIDLDTRRLPNAIVLPSYLVGAALLGISAFIAGDLSTLVSAGVGMAALFAFYLVAALVYPGGMGFGDVKLAGVLGLFLGFLGWGPLIVGAFAAFVLGGLFGVALFALRRARRGTGIPFGPWMLAGAWVGIFFGTWLGGAYLALFGLV
ncbi:prepilin peptidase [Diaminobutyricibacter sp. McL0608]|uniref:prepilin peptidase n=1 Tax=Leifsonia sp. McL0608 TaxID=3143537 RepID=UPI0031F32D03